MYFTKNATLPIWIFLVNNLNQRIIKMAHFNYSGSDTRNDFKRSP
jgi:hypothetical protein